MATSFIVNNDQFIDERRGFFASNDQRPIITHITK